MEKILNFLYKKRWLLFGLVMLWGLFNITYAEDFLGIEGSRTLAYIILPFLIALIVAWLYGIVYKKN